MLITMTEAVFTAPKFQPDHCALAGATARYSSVSHTALQAYRDRLGTSATYRLCQCGTGRCAGGNWLAWLLLASWTKFRAMDRVQVLSLLGLVVQTSLLALTTRYSRVGTAKEADRYLTSTAVVTSEALKVILCLVILALSAKKTLVSQLQSITTRRDLLKACVPSLLYTVQNNLQFVAMDYLDAATFQITYQLKILTTAVFSVCVLRRRLDALHWSALLLLAVGVAMVQLPQNTHCSNGTSETCDSVKDLEGRSYSSLVGVVSVLVMCLSSGFAGVYTEKLLKSASSADSIWPRNLQLALSSTVVGLVYVYVVDGESVTAQGFFQNYDLITWCIVLQLAFLGLVVSLVMKHLDNLVKGFASSIAIILTTFISTLVLHDLQLSCSFLLGTVVVLGSILLYNVDREGNVSKPESVV